MNGLPSRDEWEALLHRVAESMLKRQPLKGNPEKAANLFNALRWPIPPRIIITYGHDPRRN